MVNRKNNEDLDLISDGSDEIRGIVRNLERNMGIAYGLNGKAYRIGAGVNMLILQIKFMQCVIETDQLPFEIRRNIDDTIDIVEGEMARYAELLPAFERLVFDGLALSPDLDLFHRVYSMHAIGQFRAAYEQLIGRGAAEIFNDFVVALRAEGKRSGVKRLMQSWRRNSSENSKRLKVYINTLHDRYAHLTVIRLDLRYRQAACRDIVQAKEWNAILRDRNIRERTALSQEEALDDYGDDLPRVDIITATEDWRHLKDNMRGKPSLFRNLAGYACSVEFSSTGGHYLHAALIFDGSEIMQHEWLGELIGGYWVELTGGRGYYHNCNRHASKFPGTGLISHHDIEKRRDLMHELMCLAKKDQFVRVKASPKSKTFMTGHLPGPLFGRPGRPRTRA
ncbi:inovirus Gp2 family protein [Variovorax sp. KBS0712]|uniref:inovirus-type Gp2 protein n=1 Tax=Variovorax sp. KBS0712 TaxID=2578111 RepID=UPI00111A1DE3|nr:inovirus-type Gp2 protein [Variovorax sp. KBS0712]TSD54691.1 inovirus Gp2 family protein [Variovorax sp. KBS0712]